jgi:hypothetical protein
MKILNVFCDEASVAQGRLSCCGPFNGMINGTFSSIQIYIEGNHFLILIISSQFKPCIYPIITTTKLVQPWMWVKQLRFICIVVRRQFDFTPNIDF